MRGVMGRRLLVVLADRGCEALSGVGFVCGPASVHQTQRRDIMSPSFGHVQQRFWSWLRLRLASTPSDSTVQRRPSA